MATQASSDPRTLLQAKEQELSQLRQVAIAELESKLQQKEEALADVQSKFDQLRADFQYNLQLLKDRDDELHQFEDSSALQATLLADREKQLAELQASYDEAYAALKAERSAREEEALLFQSTRLDLQRQLEDERLAKASALLQATEQHDSVRRALQRSLAEAEEALSRQQRELSAGFTLEAQKLELKYRQMAEDAQQETAVFKAISDQRAAEAQAAHAREMEQLKATEAALIEARRHEQALKALTFELDSTRKLKDDTVAELTTQNTQLKHQLKMWCDEADAQRSDLSHRLARALAELEEVKGRAAADAALAAAQHEEQEALLKQKLEQAQSSVNELGDEVRELRAAVKSAHREQQEKLAALEQVLVPMPVPAQGRAGVSWHDRQHQHPDNTSSVCAGASVTANPITSVKYPVSSTNCFSHHPKPSGFTDPQAQRQEREAASDALVAQERKLGAEVRQAKEQLWAREEEVKVLRDRVGELKRTLDERRADITSFKEQVLAAGEREAELHRRLLTAELQLEDLGVRRELSAESHHEEAMRKVLEQRDAAHMALQDAQSRLVDKEVEVQVLKDALLTHTNDSKVAITMQAAAAAAVAARAGRPAGHPAHHVSVSGTATDQPQAVDGSPGPSRAAAVSEGGRPGLQGRVVRPSPLQMVGLGVHSLHQDGQHQFGYQVSQDALYGEGIALPSPLTDVPLSAQSSASFLAGVLANYNQGSGAPSARGTAPGSGPGGLVAASASAAAMRAAAYLRTSKDELDALLLQQVRSDAGDGSGQGITYSPTSPKGLTLVASLRSALQQAELQNQRLRHTLGVMREEMEVLQQVTSAAAAVAAAQAPAAIPEQATDATLLVAELQASDDELKQALQHIHVLQSQINRLQSTQPGSHSALSTDGLAGQHQGAGGVAGGDTEVSFLRNRVEQLGLECRQLRRQALQWRAAAQPRPSTPQAAADEAGHAAAALQVPLGPVMQHVPVTAGADVSTPGKPLVQEQPDTEQQADQAAGRASAETSLKEAGEQLQETQQLVERLQQENEQLMDMSNALRSERDRLAAYLVSVGGLDTAGVAPVWPPLYPLPPNPPFPQPSMPAPPTDTSPRAAHPYLGLQVQGSMYQQLPAHSMAPAVPWTASKVDPSSLSSMLANTGGVQPTGHTLYQIHTSRTGSPTASPHSSSPTRSGTVRYWVGTGSASSSPRAGEPMHQPTSPPRLALSGSLPTMHQGSIQQGARQGGADKQRNQRPQSAIEASQASGAPGPGPSSGQQQPAMRLVPPAGATSFSALQGYVLSGEGVRQQTVGNVWSHQEHIDQPGFSQQGDGEQLETADQSDGGGPDTAGQPAGLPGTASARETASQRAKLRSLQRRKERMTQPQAALDPTPRVRNWNKRDD